MEKIINLEDYIEDILDEGDPEKMFTYLRGYFKGAQMVQSMEALGFAREKHEGAIRKGNKKPYIIHPLAITCYAAGIGIRDDRFLAADLMHDVCEDTDTPLSSLPGDDVTRLIVGLLTKRPYSYESKWEFLERYIISLLSHPGAVLGKAGDRLHNLSTMEGEMKLESIEKNAVETKHLILPMLKVAKNKWPQYYDYINTYRYNIKVLCRILYRVHNITPEREQEIINELKNTPAVKE